jgi:hypothetical protein
MKKTIGGKTYVEVPERWLSGCDGCAAWHYDGRDVKICGAPGAKCVCSKGKILKEQTMSEKTAVELVDELIACPGCPSTKNLASLKSAIERERVQSVTAQQILDAVSITAHLSKSMREGESLVGWTKRMMAAEDQLKSAITMRPISELPDKVPDGCVVVSWDATGPFIWLEGRSDIRSVASHSKTFGFYILPLPKPARHLHPCYMPGCEKDVVTAQAFNGGYFVSCSCGASGPIKPTKQEANEAWGYAE